HLIDDKDEHARCRQRLLAVAEEFRWRRVVAPLARFCDAPRLAPDRASAQRAHHVRLAGSLRLVRWVKRKALAMGVSPARLNKVKVLRPVRMTIGWVNRVTMAFDRTEVATPPSSTSEKH